MNTRAVLPATDMNKTEAAWCRELELRRRAGEVQWYQYEPMALILAKATRYTPDFIVLTDAGALEAHEVKGFWRDDARAKIKIAATLFPWIRFVAISRGKGRAAWDIESISPRVGPQGRDCVG